MHATVLSTETQATLLLQILTDPAKHEAALRQLMARDNALGQREKQLDAREKSIAARESKLAARLENSVLWKISIWRARNAACTNARITHLRTNNVIESSGGEPIPATPDAIAEFIGRSIAKIPSAGNKAQVANRMRKGLVIDPAKDDTEAIAKVWSTCEKAEMSTMPQEKFDEQRAAVLRDLVCSESKNRKVIATGIIRNWISDDKPSVMSVQLARGLLGQNGKECAATKELDSATVSKLKAAAAVQLLSATPAMHGSPL